MERKKTDRRKEREHVEGKRMMDKGKEGELIEGKR